MSSERVSIRPAIEQDKAAILQLAPRLATGIAPWRNRTAAVRAARQWLADSLDAAARDEGAVLVATDRASITGVITISQRRHFTGATDGYIGELAVAAPAIRHGIGRALIAAAETWAQQRGLRHLTLHTGTANTTARRFYATLGFQEEEIRLTRPLL